MTSEQAQRGMRVRVMDHHRVEERRGLMGKVVARFGREEYIAVDVRLADGELRLFWPRDLEEIPSPRGLGGACCSVGTRWVNAGSYSPECVEGVFYEVGLPFYGVIGSPQHRARTINAGDNPYGGCAWQLPSARLPSSRPKER